LTLQAKGDAKRGHVCEDQFGTECLLHFRVVPVAMFQHIQTGFSFFGRTWKPRMTLGMAWVRKVGQTCEFIVAIDSRLSGGQAWDGCPKLLLLPRSDCVLCFAGDSNDAYPLMVQILNAINMHPRTRDRTIDIVHLKGHMSRVWKHMRTFIHSLPWGQQQAPPPDVSFIFGGYSWREKDFRFWKLVGGLNGFTAEAPQHWGADRDSWRIQFVGDPDPIREAKQRLAKMLKSRGKLPDGDFDMEPFEVLRDIIRAGAYHSVGGPPQIAKVYEHMNAVPFALYWPNRSTGNATVLGRPLLDYELSNWPILDPDNVEFRPE